MVRSKDQRKQEALERKRKLFASKLELNKSYQPGGSYYKGLVRTRGVAFAELRREEANDIFDKYLKEAQLTPEGEIYLVEDDRHYTNVVIGKHRTPGNGSVYDINKYLNDIKGFQ